MIPLRPGPHDRLAGGGDAHRRAALDEDPAGIALQRLDPLADGGGRDVQGPRGRLEGAVVDDRQQGAQLLEVHEAMLMIVQEHSLACISTTT